MQLSSLCAFPPLRTFPLTLVRLPVPQVTHRKVERMMKRDDKYKYTQYFRLEPVIQDLPNLVEHRTSKLEPMLQEVEDYVRAQAGVIKKAADALKDPKTGMRRRKEFKRPPKSAAATAAAEKPQAAHSS